MSAIPNSFHLIKSAQDGRRPGKRNIWNGGRRFEIMAKLDPVKIRYAMRRMEAGDGPEKVGWM